MTDLSPGQEVTVSGMHGGAAEVVYVRGGNVRVRMLSTHCPRTVPLSRVTPKRESKALTVGEFVGMRVSFGVPADVQLRPVPKPVTLRSERYLAYVRKHPCCLCGASPSEAHHWSHHGAARGKKCDDYRTVPLCQEHHRFGCDETHALFMETQVLLLIEWIARGSK